MQEERVHLTALPPGRFDAADVFDRLVGDDFCVAIDTNRYSVSPRFVGRVAKVRVLEGVADILIDGQPVARHLLRDTRHKRYMLPEHEEEFRAHSTSRHVLSEQFRRLGGAAADFETGLVSERGGAAGYHMSRILSLAGRVGVPRVAEALRHAVRYGAFDYGAVERIVHGKTDMPRTAVLSGPLPRQVADYLRGAGEHQRPLKSYERLLNKAKKEPPDGK
jgi:hypothetical protein